jgi:hypothetical protein
MSTCAPKTPLTRVTPSLDRDVGFTHVDYAAVLDTAWLPIYTEDVR